MRDVREEESLVEKRGVRKWIPSALAGTYAKDGWSGTGLVRTKLFPKANRPDAQ